MSDGLFSERRTISVAIDDVHWPLADVLKNCIPNTFLFYPLVFLDRTRRAPVYVGVRYNVGYQPPGWDEQDARTSADRIVGCGPQSPIYYVRSYIIVIVTERGRTERKKAVKNNVHPHAVPAVHSRTQTVSCHSCFSSDHHRSAQTRPRIDERSFEESSARNLFAKKITKTIFATNNKKRTLFSLPVERFVKFILAQEDGLATQVRS